MDVNVDLLWLHIHTRVTGEIILTVAGVLGIKFISWFGHYLVLKWSYKQFDAFMDKHVLPHFQAHPHVQKAAAIRAHHKHKHKKPSPFVCDEGDCSIVGH